VDEGIIGVGEFKRFKISVDLYKSCTAKIADLTELDNEWVFGDPGVGKSRYARQLGEHYSKSCNKWWDGYSGQELVIIDDVGLEHKCLGHHFKLWADHYAITAEVKNGSITIRPKRIIVTSNYTPAEIWSGDDQMVSAVTRRFKILNFNNREFI